MVVPLLITTSNDNGNDISNVKSQHMFCLVRKPWMYYLELNNGPKYGLYSVRWELLSHKFSSFCVYHLALANNME